jgi:DNA-binding FadR family transcriptional regulator
MDAVEELYEMRAALEGTAASLAAKHASPKDLAALARLIAEGEKLDRDPFKLYRHNRELHDAIQVAAHNRYLEKSLSALQDAIALLGPTTLAEKGRFAVAQAEHAAIVQAIAQREGETAEQLARAHVLSALETRRAILAKERELDTRGDRDGI